MKPTRKLLLVRHPKVSVSGICYGHHDVPASFEDADVDALCAKLPQVSAVWSSPLSRCSTLAARIADRLGLPLNTHLALRELGFGAFEGLSWTEIEARFPDAYAAWMGDWQRTPPPGGETLSELSSRVEMALSNIANAEHAGSSLVFTHAGVVRAALRTLEKLSWEEALGRAVPHLEPHALEWPCETALPN